MEALRLYELERPRIVTRFPSERNDNVLVESQGGRRIVVRRFRRNTERERIAFQLDVQEHLAARGIPTPAVVPTREGERITAGDPPCVAFEYVEGAAYSFDSRAQARAAARMLARVHDALDELAVLQRLARGLVHGDFHGRNLLFAGDEVVVVLDFDAVHQTVRAADVARALLAFARPRRGSLDVRPEYRAAFLQEYVSLRSLTSEERESLPALLTLMSAPRVEKCELLAAEGEDPATWAASRVDAMAVLVRRRPQGLRA